MKLSERLVRLFDYPVDDILAAMPPPSSPVWDLNPYRQNRHQVHRETRSIIFEWINDDLGWRCMRNSSYCTGAALDFINRENPGCSAALLVPTWLPWLVQIPAPSVPSAD